MEPPLNRPPICRFTARDWQRGVQRGLALVRRYAGRLGVALCGVLTPYPAAALDLDQLPDLGDESAALLSPQMEKRLGAEFMRAARRQWRVLDDADLNHYLKSLGARLLGGETAAADYHFFLIDDPTLNAFAVPGGYIGIHSGLFLAAANEAELAGVLAHEIAHIQQRHLPRLIAEGKRAQIPRLATVLAAILLSGASGAGAQALATAGAAAEMQHQLNFTRGFEQEADRLGLAALARAGFDTEGLPAFFERLQAWNRLNEGNAPPPFLRTHPVTSDRIAETRDRADAYPRRARTSDAFAHAQVRLRALLAPTAAVQYLKDKRAQSGDLPVRYGLAVAHAANGDLGTAQTLADELVRARPRDVRYQFLAADIDLGRRRYAPALQRYRALPRDIQATPLFRQRYALALFAAGQHREANAVARALTREPRAEPMSFKLLAQTEDALGNAVASHRALAEYHRANGDDNAALAQLRIARRSAGNDSYVTAGIDARSQEIKEEMALLNQEILK